MNYPLGSFPRFGHQETWALERRERAIDNSIAARQAMSEHNLMVEREFFGVLDGYVQKMEPNCAVTRAKADEILKRMARIKRKHDSGQRVYFRYLGETLQSFCRSTGLTDSLEGLEHEKLARVAELMGEEYYAKNFECIPASPDKAAGGTGNRWSEMPDGHIYFWFASILVLLFLLFGNG
jgi:hypothetical protein